MNETRLDNAEADLRKRPHQDGRGAVVRYGIGRVVTSEKLFGGLGKLEIVHDGNLYRLRITSAGKLILTK